jgi:hypothetical protein
MTLGSGCRLIRFCFYIPVALTTAVEVGKSAKSVEWQIVVSSIC